MQENARKILCDKTIGGKGELNPTQTLRFSILFHLSWAFAAAMASTTKVVVI